MAIRTLIVDDEPLARQRLRSLLDQESDVNILAECASGAEAIEAIRTQEPDLVLLDVQMPEMDGFAVLDAASPARRPFVVFVTAHHQHALPAFDVGALDYLLKPFKPARLRQALDRVRERMREQAHSRSVEKQPNQYLQRILVRTRDRFLVVEIGQIDWIESANNYILLHTGRETHILRETLSDLEERLNPEQFLRINRSAMIHRDRIRELRSGAGGDYDVVLTDGTELPLVRGIREVRAWIEFS